jgi:hypothetical protein
LPPENGDPVPRADHVLRYISKKYFDPGTEQVNGDGFLGRKGEGAPSANWMECFAPPVEAQVTEIRSVRRIKYEKNGRLARINVGQTIEHLTANANAIQVHFVHDKLPAAEPYPADPSHVLLQGVPELDTSEGEFVRDLLRQCILELFVPPPG